MRYFGAAVGFGFAAVWIMASFAGAFVCLLAAAVGYGAVFLVERTRSKLAVRAGSPDNTFSAELAPANPSAQERDVRQSVDELNRDLGYVYEPSTTADPLAAEAEYGWASSDGSAASTEA